MIVAPLNDRACLGKLTDLAADGASRDSVRALASRFRTTKELVRALRLRPQREDLGNPLEGPKLACDVPQRARLNPSDPNCFERTLTYMAAAELIDSRPVRQMATIEIPGVGRHTFPLEDGRPVILDPLVSRNMLNAGLYLIRQAQGAQEEPLTPEELIDWTLDLADEEAGRYRNGLARIDVAHNAVDALLTGEALSVAATRELSWALALAERPARMFGQRGIDSVRLVQGTLAQLARRNFSLKLGKYRIKPDWKLFGRTALYGGVGSLTKVGKVAVPIAAQALAAKYGIPPEVVGAALKEVDKVVGSEKPSDGSSKAGAPASAGKAGLVSAAPALVKLLVDHPKLLQHPAVMAQISALSRTK